MTGADGAGPVMPSYLPDLEEHCQRLRRRAATPRAQLDADQRALDALLAGPDELLAHITERKPR